MSQKSYQLTSILDIVEKIPHERIPTFLEEFPLIIRQLADVLEASKVSGASVTLPRTLTWVDDGIATSTLRIHEVEEKTDNFPLP